MHPLVNISHIGFARIDVGWGFTNRTCPFWRLYHDFEPGAAIDTKDGRLHLRPDNLVIVPAGCMFTAIPPPTPVRHLFMHFTLSFANVPLPEQAFSVAVDDSLKALLGDGGSEEGCAHDPLRACAVIYRALSLFLPITTTPPGVAGDYSLRFIRDNLHTRLSVRRMARQNSCSLDHYIRVFARRYGTTPAKFIAAERVSLAKRFLVSTGKNLDEIARHCGFASRGHLASAFKRHTGLTPAAFRAAPPRGT